MIKKSEILKNYKEMEWLDFFDYLVSFSNQNPKIEKYQLEENKISECVSDLFYYEEKPTYFYLTYCYAYSSSKLINGVLYLMLNCYNPDFYKEIGLPYIKGLDIVYEKIMK